MNDDTNLTIVPEFSTDKYHLLDTATHRYAAQSVPRAYTELFQAAPMMLRALKRLVCSPACTLESEEEEDACAIRDALAAIERAEGR